MRVAFVPTLLATLLGSCATVLTPARFTVEIASQPAGATVLYGDAAVGVTPCVVVVDGDRPELTLLHEGYFPRAVDLGRRPNPRVRWNALNLGVGLLVDVATGNDEVLDTAPAHVRLVPLDTYAPVHWRRPRLRDPVEDPVYERRREQGKPLGHFVFGLLKALADAH